MREATDLLTCASQYGLLHLKTDRPGGGKLWLGLLSGDHLSSIQCHGGAWGTIGLDVSRDYGEEGSEHYWSRVSEARLCYWLFPSHLESILSGIEKHRQDAKDFILEPVVIGCGMCMQDLKCFSHPHDLLHDIAASIPYCACGFQLPATADMLATAGRIFRLEAEASWGGVGYRAWMQGDEWRRLRAFVLARDRRCRLCGGKAQHVHHLCYCAGASTGPDELTALCDSCHAVFHEHRVLACRKCGPNIRKPGKQAARAGQRRRRR